MAGRRTTQPSPFLSREEAQRMDPKDLVPAIYKMVVSADDASLAFGLDIAIPVRRDAWDEVDRGQGIMTAAKSDLYGQIESASIQTFFELERCSRLQCRECGKPSTGWVPGKRQIHEVKSSDQELLRTEVSRNIMIPVCNAEEDSVCHLKAQQRVDKFCRRTVDESLYETGMRECSHCRKKEPAGVLFKKCSRCGVAYYCSKACQTNAWRAGHKKVCQPPDSLNSS